MSNCKISRSGFIKNLQERIKAVDVLLPGIKIFKKRLKEFDGKQYNKTFESQLSIDNVSVCMREEPPKGTRERWVYLNIYPKVGDNNYTYFSLSLHSFSEDKDKWRKIDCKYLFPLIDKGYESLEKQKADAERGIKELDDFMEKSSKLYDILIEWHNTLPHCIQSWDCIGKPDITITND